MKRREGAIAISVASTLVILMIFAAACNDWERTTYNTLATSKAVIDQAQADYQSGKIPQTMAAYKTINDAKALQATLVQSFATYQSMKAAKATSTALSAQQQIVASALTNLPKLVADVKALYTTLKAGQITAPGINLSVSTSASAASHGGVQ